MVMNPSSDVHMIDTYPDADFAGMYGHESDWIYHHFCRLSCLLAIQVTDRDGSALSTLEAKIIALSA